MSNAPVLGMVTSGWFSLRAADSTRAVICQSNQLPIRGACKGIVFGIPAPAKSVAAPSEPKCLAFVPKLCHTGIQPPRSPAFRTTRTPKKDPAAGQQPTPATRQLRYNSPGGVIGASRRNPLSSFVKWWVAQALTTLRSERRNCRPPVAPVGIDRDTVAIKIIVTDNAPVNGRG